jgi:hypothetical protein
MCQGSIECTLGNAEGLCGNFDTNLSNNSIA